MKYAEAAGRVRGRLTRPEALSLAIHTLAMILFAICMRALFRICVHGLEHYRREPSTMVLITHRRDTDGPLTASLLSLTGGRTTNRHLHYMARDDLFQPGFLAAYLTVPRPIKHLLAPLSLGPLLRAMRLRPIVRVRERSLAEIFWDLVSAGGDPRLREAMREPALSRLCGSLGADPETPIRALLRRQLPELGQLRWSPLELKPSTYRLLRARLTQQVEEQISSFAQLLDSGESLLVAPEGVISTNGSIWRMRTGTWDLLSRTTTPLRLLPVGITYDWMTPWRSKVFLEVGPQIDEPKAMSPEEVRSAVHKAFRSLLVVNMSNLFSAYVQELAERQVTAPLLLSALAEQLFRRAVCLHRLGTRVDPALLDRRRFDRRFHLLLRYAAHRERARGVGQIDTTEDLLGPFLPGGEPAPEVRYGANEFQELLGAHGQPSTPARVSAAA